MTPEFIAVLGLAVLMLSFCAYTHWRQSKLIELGQRLLASRSYSDFASGEKKLAKTGKPESEHPVGDGYIAAFE